ncbi:MAG: hypothetical protein JJT76_01205 [Clostridiaceae bacterium]|nr:hypothetical protein [Clostridiaceae bacterium]
MKWMRDQGYNNRMLDKSLLDQLEIESIHSNLNLKERAVRKCLIEHVLENKASCGSRHIASKLKMGVEELEATMDSLIEKNAIVTDENKNVQFIYPVSTLPTEHKVILQDGRWLYAMCAIDAMGVAFTLQQDISITSQCAACGEEVDIEMVKGEITYVQPEEVHILHMDLSKIDNWAGSC